MTTDDPAPTPTPEPTGAGGPIMLAIVAGLVIGFLLGQPTVGFLVGVVSGIVIATLLWMRDNRR
ncbi:hypothetical protein [Sphingomonas sp. RS2018]